MLYNFIELKNYTTLKGDDFIKKDNERLKTLKAKKWTLWDCFVTVLKAAPFWTIVCALLQVVEALVPTVMVFTTAGFVDTAIGVLDGSMEYNKIFLPLISMMITDVVSQSIYFIEWVSDVQLHARVRLYVEEAFIQKRASLKYKYIEDSKTHDLIGRACNDGASRMQSRAQRLMYLIYWIVQIVSVFAVIIAQVWWSGIISIIIAIPAVVIAVKNGLDNYKTFHDTEKIDRYANVYKGVLSHKDYLEERTTFGYASYMIKKWKEKKDEVDLIRLKTRIRTGGRENLIRMLAWFMGAGMLISLVYPVSTGQMSPGMFIGITQAVNRLVNIVSWSISYQVQYFVEAMKNLNDLSEFSQLEEQEGALDEPIPPKDGKLDTIEFRNVTFAYPNTERNILKDCSFTLNGNEQYAFVGINGAGKTTITKLLTGLYDNYEGDIFINGRNLRDISLAEIKGTFTVVNQDFAKYQIELKNNILLGDVNKKDDVRVIDAIKGIHLDEVMQKLPNGIDTPLGKIFENGVDLSGGEWQRVAIARSLYSDAPVKILDEPTAALDPIAESGIYEMFRDVTRGKSAIFITHRLGAAKIADKILVIDGGKVAEFGSHNDLIAKNGIYAEMFNTQKGWYEE